MTESLCPRCNGSGWLNCPDCKGKGIQYGGILGVLSLHGFVCTECSGKGTIGKCDLCSGTGRVEEIVAKQHAEPKALPRLPLQSYEFSEHQIRALVEKGRIGNFALGYSGQRNDLNAEVFHTTLIGRSDTDVHEELLSRLAKKKPWYAQFKFSYAATVKEAFENECHEFHLNLSTIDNKKHPQRPNGTTYYCPVPDCSSPG